MARSYNERSRCRRRNPTNLASQLFGGSKWWMFGKAMNPAEKLNVKEIMEADNSCYLTKLKMGWFFQLRRRRRIELER